MTKQIRMTSLLLSLERVALVLAMGLVVGNPMAMVPPWAVKSPIRAAGMPPIITVNDPSAMTSGGPTQMAISPTLAAGIKPIMTVGQPMEIGPPTCGMGGTAGVTIGHMCISPIRAAGGMMYLL